jgi:putative ABC transport system permease protein
MYRTSLRNLLSHKLRLMLSGLAVVLGVAFISGTMVFTDTLNKTFTDLFESAAADVTVEPAAAFETGLTGTGVSSARASLPASVVDDIRTLDGVAAVEGYVQAEGVYVLDQDGKVLDTGGAPGIGTSWAAEESLRSGDLAEGRAPEAPGEVVLDTATVEKTGYALGETVTLLTTGPRVQAELVGIFKYGEDGGLAGASMAAFDVATAQELLLEPGHFTAVGVAAEDGVSNSELRDTVAGELGTGYDVKTKEQQAKDFASSLEQALSFIKTFLLVFAGVALFVGSFLILNTFSMLVAQRTRELALLRALGAKRRQVTTSVLLEALLLGVLGSTTGLGAGFGLAYGLKALFGQLGLTLDGGLVFALDTVLWGYAVGILVTVVAAYLPARKASRVPPVAAMRDEAPGAARSLVRRTVAGSVLGGLGVAGVGAGYIGDVDIAVIGLSAFALIAGAIALSPVLAKPFVRLVGVLLPRLAGTTGHLARENAMRNPRRTAATSSALMIGLALVTGFSIIGASANAAVDELVDSSVAADYIVSTSVGQPFTAEIAEEMRAVDGVRSVTQARFGTAMFDDEQAFFFAFDPKTVGDAVNVEVVSGDMETLDAHGLYLDEETAAAGGYTLGQQVEFMQPTGGRQRLEVAGIYAKNEGLGSYLVSMDAYDATGGMPMDRYVYVATDDGADATAVRAGLDSVVAGYPVVDVKDLDEFKDEQRAQVDQMLMLINALLVLSVLIAVLGVINTLVLSVIERTRELGLLRAIGMSRRQVRRMVRLESVVISVYGAALGLGVGALLGISLVNALEGEGITTVVVPGGQLVAYLVVGAVIGVVAAAFPARRAGRLKVLDAIATG